MTYIMLLYLTYLYKNAMILIFNITDFENTI